MPTTTLMPLPKQRYTTALGTPLVGGKVYTYAAGGTTPKAAYTDAAGTTPHTNPIILNVRGEPPAPVYWSGNYRVDVRDALGNLVYSVDNYNTDPAGVWDAVKTFTASIASKTGATLVGFMQAGVGAVLRTVDSKLHEWVSPEDYGGTDSAAIQKAFNASSFVRFTPGVTYTITDPITKTGRVYVDARGATIKADGDAFIFTDAGYSQWDGGYLQEVTVPYTIQRNYATWANNAPANVTQSPDGYQPSPLDDDIYPGLSAAIQAQAIGPKIIFTCSSATGQSGVKVDGVTGRFVTVVLEGYSYSAVVNSSFQGGKDYAGIVFYNAVNLKRIGGAAIGYALARGNGNRALGNVVTKATICGVVFFGNDYWKAQGNHVQGCGESGIKTYQHDATFGTEVVCWYGEASGNTIAQNRFDGIDVSATYPTSGTMSGHNRVENNIVIGNRCTGIFSDAQSNQYIGNKCLDNGLGGITVKAANCHIASNYLEGNVKLPGVTGAYASYDLEVVGDNCFVAENVVKRGSAPAYTYAMNHVGSGGANVRNFVPNYDTYVDTANLRNVVPDIYRRKRVPTAFVEQMITDEPASIQSVLKLWRTNSQGQALSLYQGLGETAVGNISVTATATAYNTSSDYRLKENPQPITGSGAFIDALQPKAWTWKKTGERGVGFFAHELQEVSPSSVTGDKDAVDDEGEPVFQSVEYGSAEVTANVIAQMQEMRGRLDALESVK